MTDVLVEYRWLARAVASEFFIAGGDRDDVMQEALVGLWVAARDFRPGEGMSFRPFAALVIRRRLADAVKAGLRDKHRPLNLSARVGVNDEEEPEAIVELLPGGRDPLEVLLERERLAAILVAFRSLTDLERAALRMAGTGVPYSREVTGSKRLENAVDRGRRKLKAAA